MDTHEPEWIAACHEAGHAVAAHLLGVPTASVGIHGDKPGEGNWKAAETFDRERMKDTWPNYAIVGEMGKRVEIMLFGRYETRFLEADEDGIERYLLAFLGSEEERRSFKERLPRMAVEVARGPRFLEAVEALAKEIVGGELLDGEQAGEIISEALSSGRAGVPMEPVHEGTTRSEVIFRRIEDNLPEGWTPGGTWYVEYHERGRGLTSPVGVAFVRSDCEEPELDFILVADHVRGMGIGARLVEACRDRWPGLKMTPSDRLGEGLIRSLMRKGIVEPSHEGRCAWFRVI